MKRALIIFTRVPIPGKTKTRLRQILTPEECAEAHSAFLRDQIDACTRPDRWDLTVFFGSEGPLEVLRTLLPGQNEFEPQTGETLGERMEQAIRSTLERGYDRCVLVGADLPELTADRIVEAFEALEESDAVLGPTADGGYYLVGCRRPCPELFAGQSYVGNTVYEQTLRAARDAGLVVRTVLPLQDMDEPQDLRELARRLQKKPETCCPDTRKFLRNLGWMPEERKPNDHYTS